MTMHVLLFLLMESSMGQDMDRVTAMKLIEAQSSSLSSFACEYEGTVLSPRPEYQKTYHLAPDGKYSEFSGVFTFRYDGACIEDSFQRTKPKDSLHRCTILTKAGTTTIFSRGEESRTGDGLVAPAHMGDFEREGSFGRMFFLHEIRQNFLYDKARFIHEKSEVLQGSRCEVLLFAFGADTSKLEECLVERYWIDFARGGNVVKHESSRKKDLLTKTEVELREFKDREGQGHWLPYHGVRTAFGAADKSGKIVFDGKPSSIEDLYMLPSTLKLNEPMGDDRFSIKFRTGTPISDKLGQLQYEYGQDRRPPSASKAETAERLREHLREADKQGDELKAGSAERSGPGWTAWLPWVVSLAAVAGLVFVLVSRRRAA